MVFDLSNLTASFFTLPPLVSVGIISLFLSLLVTMVYRFATDQKKMREFREELNRLQAEMKKHSSNPSKMLALQKQAMEKNLEYMMQTFKPTLITFIPIILVFGWMNANFAFAPIAPNTDFTVAADFAQGTLGTMEIMGLPDGLTLKSSPVQTITDAKAAWTLSGAQGNYDLSFRYGGNLYDKPLIITTSHAYAAATTPIKDSALKSLNLSNQKLIVLDLFGWKIGWLGTYIILSLAFSMALRKALNIY